MALEKLQVVPVDVKEHGYALLDAHVAVAKRLAATWSSDELPVEVELEAQVTVERGRAIPRCTKMTVSSRGDEPVTGEILRRIPVARILAAAVATPLVLVRIGEGTMTFPARAEVDKLYDRYVKGSRRPRRGALVTDENLRQVAELYRAALSRGDPPTQTVADAMQVPRSTAARWVAKARERNVLGPSLRGRPGEQKEQ